MGVFGKGLKERGIQVPATVLVILLAAFVASVVIPSTSGASAEPAEQATASSLRTGQPLLGREANGPVLLIPVRYPLETSGLLVRGTVRLNLPGRFSVRRKFSARLHTGQLRRGDRRRAFGFTHYIRIKPRLARQIARHRNALRFRISIRFGDGLPGLGKSPTIRKSRGIRAARAATCSTVPLVLATVGRTTTDSIPYCGRPIGSWTVKRGPSKGQVRFPLGSGQFRYTPSGDRFGTDSFTMVAKRKGRVVTTRTFHIRISPVRATRTSVVALGDSVTAGFGFFGSTGRQMSLLQLFNCKPGATVFNDACSSNSSNRNSSVGNSPDYLPDYGLSRNISWAAQWANQYGITNYRNYAVTGSAPTDWLPGGQFNSTLKTIEQQNPDFILLTMGANPLLSDVLFGLDNMGCALKSDLFGDFRQCVLDAFASVNLDQNLNDFYSSLINNTTSQVVVMQYHLAIPSSALAYKSTQLEMMTELLNEVIASEAGSVSAERITVISPPRFDVGIDMTPLSPADFSCSFLAFKVDGPSTQATITQRQLLINHPLSFCSGPAVGLPWIISGDTGIHPSAAGYMQMASQVPAPGS